MNQFKKIANTFPFKEAYEEFIYSLHGTLIINSFNEIMYCITPYPPYYGFTEALLTTSIKCTMTVSNMRIILTTEKDMNPDKDKQIYFLDYKNIKLQYKKKLGSRNFTFDIMPKRLFSYAAGSFRFEVENPYLQLADSTNQLLRHYINQ